MKINLLEDNITDWRGTRIVPGAVVLFHRPFGRAGVTVEGIVRDAWTSPTGWIKVATLRSSDHRSAVQNLGVHPDRITVVAHPARPGHTTSTRSGTGDGGDPADHRRAVRSPLPTPAEIPHQRTSPRVAAR